MSKWMSIGFDPDQMDPVTEPNTRAAISGARDGAAPRQVGDLDQATRSRVEAVSGLNDSRKRGNAGAIKPLVAGRRTLDVSEWKV